MLERPVIEVRPYHIREISSLGMGQFGEVMLAETLGLSPKDLGVGESTDKSTSIRVAVKRLKPDSERAMQAAFEKEVKFMARLNHDNIVRMLAVCRVGQTFILMEYMEFGDLNRYLQKYEVAPSGSELTANQIEISTLLHVCVQVASGVHYLACLNFVHRDLATRNFLMGKDFTVKIADFALSRNLYSSHYYRMKGQNPLPIRWMATECFYGRFSEKTGHLACRCGKCSCWRRCGRTTRC
jgi:serine/threonine protein kinase